MRLKDADCTVCGHRQLDVDVETLSWTEGPLYCLRCKRDTHHEAACNGGTNTRYRFCDWSDEACREAIRYEGNSYAEYDGAVDTLRDGTQIRGGSEDSVAENRDRARFRREGPKITVSG